jgi:hypothetical protein
MEYYEEYKITNRLLSELKEKFESGDEALSLSFD